MKRGLLSKLFNLTKEYPAKTVGVLAAGANIPMLYTGGATNNNLLLASASIFLIANAAIIGYGDPKSETTKIEDPQDQKIGFKRFYKFWKYPHEFMGVYAKTGILLMLAAGIQTQPSETQTIKPLFEVSGFGITGPALTGLMDVIALSIAAYVPERTPEQIAERRAKENAGADKKSFPNLRRLFQKASDFVQINPTLTTAAIAQVALIPYLMDAFRTNNAAVSASIIVTTALFAITNIYYGMSSKRVQTPTEKNISPG